MIPKDKFDVSRSERLLRALLKCTGKHDGKINDLEAIAAAMELFITLIRHTLKKVTEEEREEFEKVIRESMKQSLDGEFK